MKQNILAITGKPGLYALVSRGRGMIIVESLDEAKKRFPVGSRDNVISINDIAIYTDDEDVSLLKVFDSMKAKEEGKITSLDPKKASKEDLVAYLAEVLPNFDRERVYTTDIKKMIQWYNILTVNGITDFEQEEPEEKEEEKEA